MAVQLKLHKSDLDSSKHLMQVADVLNMFNKSNISTFGLDYVYLYKQT